VAGTFFYRSLGRYDPLILSGSFEPATLYGFMSQKTDAYAGFGELTFNPLDRLSLIAGLRYSDEKRDAAGTYVITPVRPALPELGSTSFNATTPRASVVYDLASDDNVYFTYSKGFKSGGYNISGLSTTPFKPEFLSAYEVGLKTSPSRPVSANLSAFFYNYTDQQVQAFVNGLNVTGNAASSHIYGADADITVKASRELTLSPGFSYLHARYGNFPGAVYSVPTPPATPGGPPCLCGNETVTGNLTGYTLPDTPAFTGRVVSNYKHELGFGTLDLSATVFYTTRSNIEPSDRMYQGGYMTLAARAAIAPRDSHLSIYVYGRNLTNKAWITAGYPPATADAVVWSEPRNYGVGARYKF
jgi:iron complex outermembrane receptor protein